jgi:hypothetical protein
MSLIDAEIEVEVPLRATYDQWTQFEEFPAFMQGVDEVRQLDDTHLHWVANIAGVRREWNARITEQIPDRVVAWTSAGGTPNDGLVTFEAAGAHRTRVTLRLDLEPDGELGTTGDALGVVRSRVRGDLRRFKEYIEARRMPSGERRGGPADDEVPVGSPGRAGVADDLEGLLGAPPVVLVFLEPVVTLTSRSVRELLGDHLVELGRSRIRVVGVARVEPTEALAASDGEVQVLADPGGGLAGRLGVTYRLGRPVTVLIGSDGTPEATWVDRSGHGLVDEIDERLASRPARADDAAALGATLPQATAPSRW